MSLGSVRLSLGKGVGQGTSPDSPLVDWSFVYAVTLNPKCSYHRLDEDCLLRVGTLTP